MPLPPFLVTTARSRRCGARYPRSWCSPAGAAFQDTIIIKLVTSHMPAAVQALPESQLGLVVNDVHNVIAGNVSFENAAA